MKVIQKKITAEIIEIVGDITSKSSFGMDNAPIEIMKKAAVFTDKHVGRCFFPEVLKHAKIVHEREAKYIINNYRPVPILSTFSKISEEVL